MDIILSICVLTYNHHKYIEEAMNSILQQRFDFPIEIIVSDDASTDETQNILVEKYSKNAKLILREINLGALKNSQGMLREAKGKYIIILEGDDYWYLNNTLYNMYYLLYHV